eukprot:TRINITY_DN112775_c0_g1_i1.p1 TRINITY_DN112775_c0_g1~~TRINITY_DN112775_c0_g1_i1.p1  ORF type:complete len:474 (+),score=49.47 TRINITY_DN112775_c0_g1_i1:25-1446(+)
MQAQLDTSSANGTKRLLSSMTIEVGSVHDGQEEDDRDVIISCENIHKTYLLGIEGIPALRGISVNVYKGEFLALYGTSGGGKTSLLNILGTIDTPTKGNLHIAGMRIGNRTKDKDLALLRLSTLGFVFQTFNLLSTMTAKENVEMPMVLLGQRTKAEREERAMELLTMVGMKERANHLPSMLSGGEQQRVTIARAIANNPQILLLDEPTGDLDTRNTMIVMDLLLNLNEQGITMVMVTHDGNLKNFANRAIYLRDGVLYREEHIAPATRQQKLDELQLGLQAAKAGQPVDSFITESGRNVADESSPNATTLYRRPEGYRTYAGPSRPNKQKTRKQQLTSKLFAEAFGHSTHMPTNNSSRGLVMEEESPHFAPLSNIAVGQGNSSLQGSLQEDLGNGSVSNPNSNLLTSTGEPLPTFSVSLSGTTEPPMAEVMQGQPGVGHTATSSPQAQTTAEGTAESTPPLRKLDLEKEGSN